MILCTNCRRCTITSSSVKRRAFCQDSFAIQTKILMDNPSIQAFRKILTNFWIGWSKSLKIAAKKMKLWSCSNNSARCVPWVNMSVETAKTGLIRSKVTIVACLKCRNRLPWLLVSKSSLIRKKLKITPAKTAKRRWKVSRKALISMKYQKYSSLTCRESSLIQKRVIK